ncbi:MAG TPA: TetR family transcriptional regulator [Chthoniobacterales bacterium]|nr:TetR family transcriptional regulator [Chthoniobacterales bacterium]
MLRSFRVSRPPNAKRSRNAEFTKAAILDAALKEFAEQGLAGARMDEIAKAASVNKALLYYYFESKQRLFVGVIQQAFVVITDALRDALSRPANPKEKLLAFLDANFEVLAAHPLLARLLGHELDMLRNISPETIQGLLEGGIFDRVVPLLSEFRAVLAEGVRSGEFRSIDIDAVVPLLIMVVRTAARGMPMGAVAFPRLQKLSPARRRAAAIDFIGSAIFVQAPTRIGKHKPGWKE